MKIVYLSTNITGSGGVARVTADKANYFVKEWGYEVVIISTNDVEKEPFYDFDSRIKFHLISTKMTSLYAPFKLYSRINDLLKSIHPQLIIINDNGIKAYFAPFLIRGSFPLLLEVHGAVRFSFKKTNSRLQAQLINKLIDLASPRFAKIILLNNESKSEWERVETVVIPNYITEGSLREEKPASKKIIAIGRICQQKGYDRMLTIWQRVAERNPDWSLHIYGKVEEVDLYRQLKERAVERVYFYGESKNVLEQLREFDFFIHTAYFEGMPMVLLEAMAEGVTGVVFEVPFGIKEIIKNRWNGMLVDSAEEFQFASAVQELIDDGDFLARLRSNTQVSIRVFSKENVLPLWKKLFQEFL